MPGWWFCLSDQINCHHYISDRINLCYVKLFYTVCKCIHFSFNNHISRWYQMRDLLQSLGIWIFMFNTIENVYSMIELVALNWLQNYINRKDSRNDKGRLRESKQPLLREEIRDRGRKETRVWNGRGTFWIRKASYITCERSLATPSSLSSTTHIYFGAVHIDALL